jgi:hypothetical protein
MVYKFVELSTVTDETIEEAVNAWVSRGWQLEGIRFAMSEASRRPAMAFIAFTRDSEERVELVRGTPRLVEDPPRNR